jgi:hypothetical protein
MALNRRFAALFELVPCSFADETLVSPFLPQPSHFPQPERSNRFAPGSESRKMKIEHYKEASEDIGGKHTWHSRKWVESPVVYATVGTIRKVNCVFTCRRFIAGSSQIKILSRMIVPNKMVLRIGLVHQRKNGPGLLDS